MKKNRIFRLSEDKFATTVVYSNEGNVLFFDEEFKVPVTTDEALYLFVVGAVVAKGEVYYRPVSFTEQTFTVDSSVAFTVSEPVEE